MTPFTTRRRFLGGFLGGAAVVIPLPFLPSSFARASRGARRPFPPPPKRLVIYHVPNGFFRKSFTPTGGERDFRLSPTLAPLEDLRQDILIPRGLANTVAVPVPSGGAHAVGCAALLTCRFPRKERIQAGISFDQVAARVLGQHTRFPSLQHGLDNDPGIDEIGWPAGYQRHISWLDASRPLPNIISPKKAFERMFLGFDPRARRQDIERRRALRASVLDTVVESAVSVAARLDEEDRKKLDQYLTSVREFEIRLARAAEPVRNCKVPRGEWADANADMPTRVTQFHDLMVLALTCDLTRVITFQLGNGLSPMSYPHLGIVDNGHAITHHSGDKDKIEKEQRVDLWRVRQLASFLKKLKEQRDADGTSILYNSAVLYLSEIGDGNKHDQHDKPMVIAGQLGGKLRTGRQVFTKAPDQDNTYPVCDESTRTLSTPEPDSCTGAPQLSQLYMTLLEHLDCPVTEFGDTGRAPLTL